MDWRFSNRLARDVKRSGAPDQANCSVARQVGGMEGPVIFIVCGALTLVSVWFYTTFFQTIAPRSLELEAAARARTLLASFTVRTGSEARVAETLTKALATRRDLVATLGGWPWTLHALRVAVETSPGVVELRMVACRVRKSHAKEPMALTDVLVATIESHTADVRDNWLLPVLNVDVSGRSTAEDGWRLVPSLGRRRPCRPRASAESEDALAPVIAIRLRKSA
jgi:hypothetical protein